VGKRGPARKPSAQKKRQGTYRKDRAPKSEVQPASSLPSCPDHFDAYARAYWEHYAAELNENGLLTALDGPEFGLLCQALGRSHRYSEILEAEGDLYVTPTGFTRIHPATKLRGQAEKLITQLAPRFGMNPSARSSIDIQKPAKKDDDELFLFGQAGPQLVKDEKPKKKRGRKRA